MAKLESYSNLTKPQDDLMKKNFCVGQDLALSIYARSAGVIVKSSFKQKIDALHGSSHFGSTYFQYKGPALTLKQELGSNSLSKTTVEYIPEKYPQFKDKFEVESNVNENLEKHSISVEYTHEKLKGKLAVADDFTVKLSGVFGLKSYFGGGIDLAFDTNRKRFNGYNAALWLFKEDYKAVLKHVSTNKKGYSLGNLVASVYLPKVKDLEIAAVGSYTVQNGEYSVQGVVQKKLENGNLVKARTDLNGLVGFALRNKLSSAITVVSAAEFNIFDASRSLKFGLRLKFNQ